MEEEYKGLLSKLTPEQRAELLFGKWQPPPKPPQDKFYICAPNHRRFVEYCVRRNIPATHAVYISSQNKAHTIVNNAQVVIVAADDGIPFPYAWEMDHIRQILIERERRGNIRLQWDDINPERNDAP